MTAVCTRAGDWWAVSVPEVEGAFTQVRQLDEVPGMVAEVVSLLRDVSSARVSVEVQVAE